MFNQPPARTPHFLRLLCGSLILVIHLATPHDVDADLVTFGQSPWDHGAGVQTEWQAPTDPNISTYSGTSTLTDGTTVTLRVTNVGSVTHFGDANDHLMTLPNGTSDLLNFSSNSQTSQNINNVLENYVRIDIELSRSLWLHTLWHDIDRGTAGVLNDDGSTISGSWTDIIAAENFGGGTRTPGAGKDAIYLPGANLQTTQELGLTALSAAPNTGPFDHRTIDDAMTPNANSAWIRFRNAARYYSFYYWNGDPNANPNEIQRVFLTNMLITGNQITTVEQLNAAAVPEPAAWMLSLMAAGTAVVFRSRKKKKTDTPQ